MTRALTLRFPGWLSGFGNIAMCGCVNSASVIVNKGPRENYSDQYQKITVGLFRCVSWSSCHPMLILDQGIVSLYDPCTCLTLSWTAET